MEGLWDAVCTTVQEAVGDLEERLPEDLKDHLLKDLPERLLKGLEKGLQSIAIKDERARRLLGAFGGGTPPPAGSPISAGGCDEPSTSSSRHPAFEGNTMLQHPAEVEFLVPPAPDFKDAEDDVWDNVCTVVKETVEVLWERLRKDLTANVRRDISKGLQKVFEAGLPKTEHKDELYRRPSGAPGAVTPPPAEPLISGETQLELPAEVEFLVPPAPEFKDGEDVYRMSTIPRGKCIIINNQEFVDHRPSQLGSEIDVDRMERLFTALHFDVCTWSNLEATEMKRMLSAEAEAQRNESSDCLVVIIMSYGLGERIEGIDGEYLDLMEDVYSLFNNDNCPALQGKPKIFFIQACRGGNYDNGIPAVHGNADTSSDVQKPPIPPTSCPPYDMRRPSWSDMFFAHATIPRYVAHRNCEFGSLFISSVYDVFRREACRMHLQDMMRLVDRQVMAWPAHDGCRQTASTITWAWTKTLYFNPGHFR